MHDSRPVSHWLDRRKRGEYFRIRRVERCLSINGLAKKLGMSRMPIRRLESGLGADEANIRKIAAALGISIPPDVKFGHQAKTCSFHGCKKPHAARGFCSTHWCRWRKHGDPSIVKRWRAADRICQNCGRPFRHLHKRKACSRQCVRMLNSKKKIGPKNPIWKDSPGLSALHTWVHRNFPKPDLCMRCSKVSPIDAANISGKYKRELSDWEWLCRRCHMLGDGRMKNLSQYANV